MASTLRDFFNRALSRAQAGAENTYDWMKERVGGIRGQAQPAADPFAEYGPRQPSAERMSTPEARAAARGPQRPAWGAGPSPEAQAYQASRSAAAAPREAAIGQKAGTLRGLARAALPATAAYGGIKAAVDAAREGNTDLDYQLAETPVGKLLTGGPSVLMSEGIAHATSPIRAAMVGAGRRFINAVNPFGEFGGGEPPRKPPVAPTAGTPPPPPPSPDLVDTIRGTRVTPGALLLGTEVPAEGQGAFQRTGGPARKVGYTREAPPAEMISAREYDRRRGFAPTDTGLRKDLSLPELAAGFAGARTRYAAEEREAARAARAAREALGAAVTMRGQDLSAGAARAQLRAQLAEKNKEGIEKLVGDYANAKIPEVGDPKQQPVREAGVKKSASDILGRVRYTAGAMGGDVADLSPQLTQRLLLGETMRERVEKYYGDPRSWARDFFGEKRVKSRDLRSYMPKTDKAGNVLPAERTKMPGESYIINLGNGGRISVAAAADGGFNWLGPNEPVDAEMMAIIAPAIEAARRKQAR